MFSIDGEADELADLAGEDVPALATELADSAVKLPAPPTLPPDADSLYSSMVPAPRPDSSR